MKNLIILGLAILVLSGCASMKISDFENTEPAFVLEEYFNGPMTAYGVVKGRSGKIMASFRGELVGSWDTNGVGTLDEVFIYDDGSRQERVWTFTPTGDNTYIGTANDVVGPSPMITVGNTLKMDYTLQIQRNGNPINVQVEDWLHLQEDGVIINHSQMYKFGIRVGELVITIIKDFP